MHNSYKVLKIETFFGVIAIWLGLLGNPSFARITPLAFKDVTKYFKKEVYSPTIGMIALDSGLIYNLRFYGHFSAAVKTDGTRNYIQDKSDDPTWNLVKILFPSPAGQLAVETNALSNFGRYGTPQTLAILLNYAHDLRSESSTNDQKKLTDLDNEIKRIDSIINSQPILNTKDLNKLGIEKAKHNKEYNRLKQNAAKEGQKIKDQLTASLTEDGRKLLAQPKEVLKTKETLLKNIKKLKEEISIYQTNQSSMNKELSGVAEHQLSEVEAMLDPIIGHEGLSKNISDILTSIRESIGQETENFYPAYTTEQIILAFFCEKFNEKKDIIKLIKDLQNLKSPLVLTPRYEDSLLPRRFSQTLLTEKGLTEILQKTTLDLDDFYNIAANYDLFSRHTPYKPDSKLLSNGISLVYDRSNHTLIKTRHFADCVETTIRHLVNLLVYNSTAKQFDLSSLENYVDAKNPYFANLKEFYNTQSPNQANDGSILMRSLWNQVVGDLNTGQDASFPVVYLKKITDTSQFELETGYINLIRVFQKLINLRLPEPVIEQTPFLQQDISALTDQNEQKEWLKAYLKALFQAMNSNRTYEIDMTNLKWSKEVKDYVGTIQVVVSDQDKKLFSFDLSISSGHGELRKLKHYGAFSSKQPKEFLQKFHQDKSSLDSLYLLIPNADLSALALFYQLYHKTLDDNNAIIETIKKFTKQNTFDKKHREKINSFLINILNGLSWSDVHTLRQISPHLPAFWKKFPDVKDHIKGYYITHAEKREIEEAIKQLPNLKFLHIENTRLVETLNISGFKNFEGLYLNNSSIRKIEGLTDYKNLKVLDIYGIRDLSEVDVSGLINLENLSLDESSINKIDGLTDCTALKILSLRNVKTLQEIDVSTLINLENLSIEGSSIAKIIGLINCQSLNKLGVKGVENLKELPDLSHLPNLKITR